MLIPVFLALVATEPAQPDRTAVPPDSVQRNRAIHALNRLTFGPRPGDVDRVLAMGLDRFIEDQLDRTIDPQLDTRIARLPVSAMSNADLGRLYFELIRERRQRQQAGDSQVPGSAPGPAATSFQARMGEFQQIVMLRAVESERQLYEVLIDFWTNHFNVFTGKGPVRFLVRHHVEEVIRPHAMGRFETLLRATAQSPAMLVYLDNLNSVAPGSVPPQIAQMRQRLTRTDRNPRVRRGQNARRLRQARARMERAMERMPTGLNENYARELLELHTVGVDGGYAQVDVVNVARILTGWSADIAGRPGATGGFRFNAWAHDTGDKVVLGRTYGADGVNEGFALLHDLANHPATQRHVTSRLCERFVSDVATEGCIQSGTAAWRRTGGDIREVLRAIVTSDDFWAPRHRGAKVKTPLEFVVSGVRALAGHPENAQPMVQLVRRLGQPLFGHETPTGYAETQADWVNAGALLNRLNVGLALASGRGRALDLDLDQVAPLSLDADQMVTAINEAVLNRQASANTLRVMRERGSAINNRRQRRALLLGLALGSPEFQRQ